MKKTSLFLLFFCMGMAFKGFSQTAPPTDFFAGKWEIFVAGTPNGDVKMVTDLVRKDGKLTGELVNQADPANGKRKITKVEETEDRLVIYFETSEIGEISVDLKKVDTDNLKGTLYNFDATAKRIK